MHVLVPQKKRQAHFILNACRCRYGYIGDEHTDRMSGRRQHSNRTPDGVVSPGHHTPRKKRAESFSSSSKGKVCVGLVFVSFRVVPCVCFLCVLCG